MTSRRSSSRFLAIKGVVALFCVVAEGAGALAAEPPQVRAAGWNGETVVGELVGVTTTEVALAGTERQTLSWDDVRRLEFRSAAAPAAPREQVAVSFVNGDLLWCRQVEIVDDRLIIQFGDEQRRPFAVDVGLISVVHWNATVESRLTRDAQGSRGDVAWLANGDRVAGELVSLKPSEATMRTSLGEMRLTTAQIAALSFDPALAAEAPGGSRELLATFVDGGSVTASDVVLTDGTAHLRSIFGGELTFAGSDVQELRVVRSPALRSVDLSDAVDAGSSFFGTPLSAERNRSADGRLMRAGGAWKSRGWGVRSRTEIRLPVPQEAKSFAVSAAIDERAAELAGARLEIRQDGSPVWRRELAPGDGVVEVPIIDVSTATGLTLIVDFGPRADVADLVDWIAPTFLFR